MPRRGKGLRLRHSFVALIAGLEKSAHAELLLRCSAGLQPLSLASSVEKRAENTVEGSSSPGAAELFPWGEV